MIQWFFFTLVLLVGFVLICWRYVAEDNYAGIEDYLFILGGGTMLGFVIFLVLNAPFLS